jgi:hypothetical protein
MADYDPRTRVGGEFYDCTPTSPCRACRDQMAAKDAPIEPARPVEDRESVGRAHLTAPFGEPDILIEDEDGAPFPEETQQLFREVAQDAYLRGIRDQREREFEAGYRTGWRDRDLGSTARYEGLHQPSPAYMQEWMQERFDQIEEMIASQRQDDIGQQQAIRNAYDQGYERGRQQGDADRAARGQTEFERGRASVSNLPSDIDRIRQEEFVRGRQQGAERADTEFKRGRTIGRSERETELLEAGWTPQARGDLINAGWTPPGGVIIGLEESREDLIEAGWLPPGQVIALEHEFIDSSGPTDYEVWRDALRIALDWCPDGTSDEDVLIQADIWRDRLKNYPTITTPEADQAVDDQLSKIDGDPTPAANRVQPTGNGFARQIAKIDRDETSWGPKPTIDPTNTPLDEPRG